MASGAAIAQGVTDIASSALGAHFAHTQAKKARQFTREVYHNRYQWTMSDMRAAGLNPILAYSQGTGGGVGGGPQASSPSIPKTNYATTSKQLALMDAEKEKLIGETANAWAASERNAMEANRVRLTTPAAISSANSAARAAAAGLPVKEADEKFYKSTPGQWTRMLQRLLQGARGAGSN